MLRHVILSPQFALAELLLIVLSGVIWAFNPELGLWFTLLALLPCWFRFIIREPLFKRTPFDWLMAVFLITTWIGYWAAFNKEAAWIKAWLIVTAVFLYYAICAQSKRNLEVLSQFSFFLALAISLYFFFAHDFTVNSGRIASWWMDFRPHIGWPAIYHGYVSGLLVVTSLFACYWLRKIRQISFRTLIIPIKLLLILGIGVVLWAFVLTASRGVWATIACGLGIWFVWEIITSGRLKDNPSARSLFPFIVMVYLAAIIVFLYLGPARLDEVSSQVNYATNSRAGLFDQSAYFLLDFPLTGGGLNSFPELYSQYILIVPTFYFINSYNMFLDVAVEQGILGGLAFIYIYLGSIWFVSMKILSTQSQQMRFFNWLSLFALIFIVIHGMIYDYLYNGLGTLLLFYPVGVSMVGVLNGDSSGKEVITPEKKSLSIKRYAPLMMILPVLCIAAILTSNLNRTLSIWYSNLGAIQMSQVELKHFPTNKWATAEIVPQLEGAEASFRSALLYDPDNLTANYRLGLISMLRQDFESAAMSLETAYQAAPSHRGIIKNLGYCYVWLGEEEKAQAFLEQIPEAQSELNNYVWWWDDQGRADLSANASQSASSMNNKMQTP